MLQPNTVWISGFALLVTRSRTIVDTAPAFEAEKDSLGGSSIWIFEMVISLGIILFQKNGTGMYPKGGYILLH